MIEPSNDDLDIAKAFLVERVEDFKDAKSDTAFIINNSDTKNFDFKAGVFPKEMDSIVNNAKDGEVIGPYRDGDFYKISKVIKNGFEQEATVRHILLGNNVYPDQAAQEFRADSLVAALKANSRKFEAAVEKFSTDLGSKNKGGK